MLRRLRFGTSRARLVAPLLLLAGLAHGSSHRDSPFTAANPQIDATDLYAFRSYEAGRDGYVVFIANYNPFQNPRSGPNSYPLSRDAMYDIHIDNNDDAVEDITFRFRMGENLQGLAFTSNLGSGPLFIPLPTAREVTAEDQGGLNFRRPYHVQIIRGETASDTRSERYLTQMPPGPAQTAEGFRTGSATFQMPYDNVGSRSFPDYTAYANQYIYDVDIPGCSPGRVFAGPRKESYRANVGGMRDLFNFDLTGDPNRLANPLEGMNITSLAIEVPISCVAPQSDGAAAVVEEPGPDGRHIGVWTSAALPGCRVIGERRTFSTGDLRQGEFTQVSRLAHPLINEAIVPIGDKDLFNRLTPTRDLPVIVENVLNPVLPALLGSLYGIPTPPEGPRNDLMQLFVPDMLRLNVDVPVTPFGSQNPLGDFGGDGAGYPNGRRVGDDVTDVILSILMSRTAPDSLNDGVGNRDSAYLDTFPYLGDPWAGDDPPPGFDDSRVPEGFPFQEEDETDE